METQSSLDSIEFVITPLAGKIHSKERPRRGRGDNVYTPLSTIKWERHIKACLLATYPEKIDGKQLTFWLGCQPCAKYQTNSCPHTCKQRRHGISISIWMYVKGTRLLDISNTIKAIEDALNGVAYHDDNQIVEYDKCIKVCNANAEKIVVRLKEIDGIRDEAGT